MSGNERSIEGKRHTISDEVFHFLLKEIISLKLEPGTQLSEAEVAKTFGVSRQPVREALMRLGDLDLLLIRPQKATMVKKISLADIAHTRFIRSAVEVEVVRVASMIASDDSIAALRKSLDQQSEARADSDPSRLRELDYVFHRLVCEAAEQPEAFTVVSEFKAHTDRVCMLELADDDGMAETIEGHTNIVEAIAAKEPKTASQMARIHLTHLDLTIQKAEMNFPDFFEE